VVVRDPGANLVAKRLFLGGQRQVHGDGETIGGGDTAGGRIAGCRVISFLPIRVPDRPG
jgi:hypothetical protein